MTHITHLSTRYVNIVIMKIFVLAKVHLLFLSSLSWIKTIWFTWRPTTSCWSRGWRSSRTRSIFRAAASSSRQSRSSTHTSSVTWLLLTAPGTWWDNCVSPLVINKHSVFYWRKESPFKKSWKQKKCLGIEANNSAHFSISYYTGSAFFSFSVHAER